MGESSKTCDLYSTSGSWSNDGSDAVFNYNTDYNAEYSATYDFPRTYRIGQRTTDRALVDVHQLKLHLRLLRAFHDLRIAVQDMDSANLPPHLHTLDKTHRWAFFLHLAVERFEWWVSTLPTSYESPNWAVAHIPPLDVLMVWHTYMLNPTWYAEDGLRIPELAAMPRSTNTIPQLVELMGDPLTHEPSEVRTEFWLASTKTTSNPLEAMDNLFSRTVVCPHCRDSQTAPFFTEDGTGYAQRKFELTCKHCSFVITKEKLGVAKFARDLSRMRGPANSNETYGQYMAGTLHTPTTIADTAHAGRVKAAFLDSPKFALLGLTSMSENGRGRAIQKAAAYSLVVLDLSLAKGVNPARSPERRRVLSAYVDDRLPSVELVGAMLRQESFINKMHDLGWTEESYFDSEKDEMALQHAIARYHAFLDLMASSPSSFLVPTLDIDLAWHTHQLYPDKYSSDCRNYVGRYIDHDDKVEESRLSKSFDVTGRLWQLRFNIPYTYCGCPVPGSTIGDRVSKLTHHTLSKSLDPRPSLEPVEDDESSCAATHPSDHNAFYTRSNSDSDLCRTMRKNKVRQRRQRDAQAVKKGKMDKRVYERGTGHPIPFLVAVPLNFPPACVSASGNVLDKPLSRIKKERRKYDGDGIGDMLDGTGQLVGSVTGGSNCGSNCGGGGGGGCGGGGGGD